MTGRNMRRKSMVWSRHGKHAKIDPYFITHERKRLPSQTRWYTSVKDLFRKER